MGSASLRKSRVLALSLAAVVGTMTLAVSPVLAAPGTGPVASENIPAPDVNAGEEYTQFIVSFKKTPGNATPTGRANAWGEAARRQGVSVKELRALATGGTLIASDKALSDQAAEDFMDGIVASGEVNAVEPDARMTAVLTPNDTRYAEQWDFTAATACTSPAPGTTPPAPASTVAVIDTGITAHPDLDANILAGYDFISDAAVGPRRQRPRHQPGGPGRLVRRRRVRHRPRPPTPPGTAPTSPAPSPRSPTTPRASPASRTTPRSSRSACSASAAATCSDIADAITWASGGTVSGVPANANPAKVINMSLGGSGACGTTYQTAINAAVSAAPRWSSRPATATRTRPASRPANCANVVTVAASNPRGARSYYSNYGSTVDIAAPGGDTGVSGGGILSTLNTGTTTPAAPATPTTRAPPWRPRTSPASPP